MNLKKPTGIILLLVWCLFMGVTAISIGFGAAFPALNRLAGPVVCPNGDMRVDEQTYRPSPGTTVTTMDWQCVDKKTGEAQPVNELNMFLFNGLIYGFVLFSVILLGYWIAMKWRAQRVAAHTAEVSNSYTSVDLPSGVDVTSADKYELQELTRMYQEGQFSEKKYQRKRKAILDRVAGQVTTTSSVAGSSAPYTQSGNSEDTELQELKRMLDEGQLTTVEYWQKLSKIHDRPANQSTAEHSVGGDATPPATRSGNLGDYNHSIATTSRDSRAADELRKLKSLLDEGLITQQDYDQKKAEILSRM